MPEIKDKKDVSVLLETQLPEFISDKHPKFKKFIEKYYEFMESHQLYFGTSFTFNDDKLVDESDGTSYFLYEDGVRLHRLHGVRVRFPRCAGRNTEKTSFRIDPP